MPKQTITAVSHVLMAVMIIAVLMLKLTPAAITGFVVYSLTLRGAGLLLKGNVSWHVKPLALALVIGIITLAFVGGGLLAAHFLNGKDGLSWVMLKLASILGEQRSHLPAFLQAHLPASVEDMNAQVAKLLQENSAKLSEVGVDTLRFATHVILGLVIGALIACFTFKKPQAYQPLSAALLERVVRLREAFEKVVFAQVKISAINTTLTAIYLLIALPFFGVQLPLAKTLIFITFVAGLLPVIGNLISNSVILLISFGMSLQVTLASLLFLMFIHKLEYFINARIIGVRIEAAAWELIIAMLAMEGLFGLAGLVVAPVLYAYMKGELIAAGLAGHKPA